MARVAKIDNAVKKRFSREEKKRSLEYRSKRVYFLIVCEGEKTEPKYFEGFKNDLPIESVELQIEGTGLNTIGIIEFIIELQKKSIRKYDRVWAVFDKDDFPDENFNNAIYKAESKGIECAWSNEAFELWYILHFQYLNTGISRDNFKRIITQEVQVRSNNESYEYEKNSPITYEILKSVGNLEQAINWAKKLEMNYSDKLFAKHNPCTKVYELVLELSNPEYALSKISSQSAHSCDI
jgi:hypothetical protein